jgi:proliferating cell nuclear antigen
MVKDDPNISMAENRDSTNVLTIKTIQIAPFKTLMTALKDILIETNIVITPQGLRIVNMDKTHTILVHISLPASNFEFFECKKEKIVIGVNMTNFHKLINTIDCDDTLVLYIEDGDYDDGVVQSLGMRFENGNIRQCKTQKLRLIEADADELEYPNVTFSSELVMPSNDFQKIVRDLSAISDTIEIKSFGDELIFKVAGCFAEAEVHRYETDGGVEFIKKQDSAVVNQGIFSLKNLGYFIKCTNLCSQIELYLENDMPLVVKYNVASLGEIKLCLAPLPSM